MKVTCLGEVGRGHVSMLGRSMCGAMSSRCLCYDQLLLEEASESSLQSGL